MSEVTRILTAIEQGDRQAADKLLPLVYEELRKLAAWRMANEAAAQTLQPTTLVHEACKLAAQSKSEAELVKLRHFVGMTLEEAADALGISARTADNYWAHARAWLFQELNRTKD